MGSIQLIYRSKKVTFKDIEQLKLNYPMYKNEYNLQDELWKQLGKPLRHEVFRLNK